MSKINFFSSKSNGFQRKIKFDLDLYMFREEHVVISYCPALDLSSYGNTKKEAIDNFIEMFKMYLEHCSENGTLIKDLKKHGWNIKSQKQRNIKSPSTLEMLQKNKILQDIVNNREYEKKNNTIEVPAFV